LKLLKKHLEDSHISGLWIEGVPMEHSEPDATALGETFFAWLRDALENQTLTVNEKDSFVHMLDEGIFLETPSVYEAFNRTYSNYRDFIVLQEQFNHLGVTKLSGYDFKFEQHFAQRADTAARLGFLTKQQDLAGAGVQQGVIIKDPGVLYSGKTAVPQKSQFMKDVSVNWAMNNALPTVKAAETPEATRQIKPSTHVDK
jgi:hypothetical protein